MTLRFKRYSVEELCTTIASGGTPVRSRPEYYFPADVPWIKTGDLKDSYIDEIEECISTLGLKESSAKLFPPETVVVAMYGATAGKLGIVRTPAASNQAACGLIADSSLCDSRFLFYLLLNDRQRLESLSTGAAQQNLSVGAIRKLEYDLPELSQQRAIAEVLGALDDKIAANRKLIDQLRSLSQTLFRHVMVQDSVVVKFGEVAEFHNRKRIPLSAIERESMRGAVPYYGAAGVFGYVNRALFDEIVVLIGEDGSVVTDDGRPVTQYIWGPAWVNNHAHVVTGTNLSTEILLLAIERANIEMLVTGAVQPKLSMGNLKRLELAVPGPSERIRLDDRIQPMFAMIRSLSGESRHLGDLRDALLPRLMSGKLRVRDAEDVVSNAV
ncbi:Type I restriction enzyme specificity protein MG438 [Rhodococcus rhodochrous]|uniref:restriction endonuclease subunit S n=1 Tax=Rhodococcus rhodochrous TaxID=1829 RepID=UPI0009BC2FB7|nr:restriction endonuclease subunit S [Rhodococcus rhodochrous]MDO1484658.1 restriction endonuclease subunit S [Rhodococcus rhodochrous]SNV27084.1 Type I restriction enzyme specificity protein MG438 [Rhodococcus rhodochrous]